MTSLPNECLILIFNNFLRRKRYKDLFSCLLVNRQWCRIVVPIIWGRLSDYLRNRKFINTCVLALNAEERSLLIPFNATLTSTESHDDDDDDDKGSRKNKGNKKENELILPNLLFEYTSYITSIDRRLNEGIFNWLKYKGYEPTDDWKEAKPTSDCEDDKLFKAVKTSLITMFLRTSLKLKTFEIKGSLEVKGILCNDAFKNLCNNPIITILKLNQGQIDPEGMKTLIEAINKTPSLTSLYLYQNQLDLEGCKILSEAFCKNNIITSLKLCNNGIGLIEGEKEIAKILHTNTKLISLNLSGNSIDGGKALAGALCKNTTLTSLDLSSNSIKLEGANELAKSLRTNTTLTSLSLRSTEIGDEGGRVIAEALCKNTTLKSLNLGDNRIVVEGGKAIASTLCKNTTLISLNLADNIISVEGGRAIAAALCANDTLISLDLSSNHLKSAVKAIGDALHKNTTLTTLNLENNGIDTEEAKTIENALNVNSTLTSLNLGKNELITNFGKSPELLDMIYTRISLNQSKGKRMQYLQQK